MSAPKKKQTRVPGLAPAVSSLVETMVSEAQGPGQEIDPESLERTKATMHRRLQMMPRFLGVPMMGATLVFDWMGMLRAGRPFHLQNLKQRSEQLESWRSSSIGFLVNFVDFYEKMAKFGYFYDRYERGEADDRDMEGEA